ncbi:MAG: SusC/RagA family TonB-linked outer membrane protein [Porphyromonas sp.]|nr:SusC/RagA family TonB-linked outer membrane protein [Bacteroidales bacterium]MDY3100694.1 SusC/RagA family TonB-linked outer membrane protein [Porphyromonas sp.]
MPNEQAPDHRSVSFVTEKEIEDTPHTDLAKTLYGRLPGLWVTQGKGMLSENYSGLSLHGQAPVVVIDGMRRELSDILPTEVASVTLLKDAVSASLYGVRGGRGVLLVTTKRGAVHPLKVTTRYQFGLNTPFRIPVFSDSHTYAVRLNQALGSDGLEQRYSDTELTAFKSGDYPYAYPNTDWWKETMNDYSANHRLSLTFNGGTDRFAYFAVAEYMHDQGLYKYHTGDDRYSSKPTDVTLNVRANVDVALTETTKFHIGLKANLLEVSRARRIGEVLSAVYRTPSAAFPVYHEDRVFAGNAIYTDRNPVALLTATGQTKNIYSTLLADALIRQDFGNWVNGLYAEAFIGFDNAGVMFENSNRTYRYKDLRPRFAPDGKTVILSPVFYGTDSETLGHGQGFNSLSMDATLRGTLGYDRCFSNVHKLQMHLTYEQESRVRTTRNMSTKTQSLAIGAFYSYAGRYDISGVISRSGSAYLPKGDRFYYYPSLSAGWNVHNEAFWQKGSITDELRIYASFGKSGWDGDLTHELYMERYGWKEGTYFFTPNAALANRGEGSLPTENLRPETVTKRSIGVEGAFFNKRLVFQVEGFYDDRKDILMSAGNTVSKFIGIEVGRQNVGHYRYSGADFGLIWNGVRGDFKYGLYATGTFLSTKVIRSNQGPQPYDYLYHEGNPVGQQYGLEAIGFFESEADIASSPEHTFFTVTEGDVKYKDQNADEEINALDIVKIGGSSIPNFNYGFGFSAEYRGFEVSVAFQGVTGNTVNLLSSPLYKPLVENGNISDTFLDNEIPWTTENASVATMPRLTTLQNGNNYQNSSLWFRDGSFLKLRNVSLSYTFGKELIKFADLRVYINGSDLFSIDGIKTLDPENLDAGYPSQRMFWAGLQLTF